jgi:hypothetical protein
MTRFWPALAPPLGAFLLARLFLSLISMGTSRPPWEPGSWSGPDTAHYLSIAKHGYAIFPCSPEDPPPGHCGNAGWMPAYPWALRPLMAAGASPRWAAVLVSAAFAFLSLALLWIGALRSWREGGPLALLVAAFFPGQVYQHGAFPLAQFSLLAVLCLLAARHERWLLAGLAGFLAALTYSTGWLLAPVLVAWALASPGRAPDVRLRRVGLAAVLTFGGFLTVLLVQGRQTGVWNAFFAIQGAYGHHLSNPLLTWWLAVKEVFTPPWQGVQEGPQLQTLLVSVWVACLLARRFRAGDRAALLPALYALAFWTFPLAMGSGVSLYRSEATLLPSVLLMEGLPRPAIALVLVAAVLVAWPMGVLFFRLLLV